MPAKKTNSEANRLRMIYLYKILYEKTDNEHSLTLSEIADELESMGAPVARKALYEDLRALAFFGADIRAEKGRHSSYRLASRTFEPAELRLIADAVNSSRFLSSRQSNELLKKLQSLTSVHMASDLRSQLFIAENKSLENRRIMSNIELLSRAVTENRQVRFRYFDYDVKKNKVYREGSGEGASRYDRCISPYALAWDDEKYYVVAFNPKHNGISNFRIDKMEHVRMTDEPSAPLPKGFDVKEYLAQQFSMFAGDTETVKLRFDNSLIGTVLDRFGMQTMIIPDGDRHFRVNVSVKTTNTFFGWLFQFGSKAEVLTPSVRERYREALLAAAAVNGGEPEEGKNNGKDT